jgi:hypothetical protein
MRTAIVSDTAGQRPILGLRSLRSRRRALDASDAAFGGLLALGALVVLVETRGMSFFGDDWDFVVDRRGTSPSVLLKPHGPHLSLIPILIYKTLLQVFGGGSYLPFRLLTAFDLVLLSLVLGMVARGRWGKWWGLAPVLLFVTLGQAGTSLLWSFQCGYAIATAAGLIALLSLGRGGRRGDVLACGALIVSLASASQGIGFTVGAAVILATGRDGRRRAWVVVIPAVLYALWYLKYGQQYSETQLSLWNTSLAYGVQSLSATFGPLLALSMVSPQTSLLDVTYGAPLALVAIAAVGYFCWRGWRPRPLFWAVVATLIVLWFATSLANTALFYRPPNDPRYLSTNAFLVMICLLTAIPRPRLALRGGLVVALILIIIGATNTTQYSQSRDSMLSSDQYSRAQLGALLIMRGVVAPTFAPSLTVEPSVLVGVDAANFYSAYDKFGVLADSPEQILRQSEAVRESVDAEMARGELSLAPFTGSASLLRTPPTLLSGTVRSAHGCLVLGTLIDIRTLAGSYELRASSEGPMTIAMGRFGSAYSVALGSVPARVTAVARVPQDRVPQVPWRMAISGAGTLCRLAPS